MNLYRLHSKTFSVACERPTHGYACNSPRMARPVLHAIYAAMELDMDREHFVVLVLDAKGRGLLRGHSKQTFSVSIFLNAHQSRRWRGNEIIPSDPTPSREDALLTAKLRSSGETLGLSFADHIILGGDDSSYSFRTAQGWDGH